jgi:hypothetical protein
LFNRCLSGKRDTLYHSFEAVFGGGGIEDWELVLPAWADLALTDDQLPNEMIKTGPQMVEGFTRHNAELPGYSCGRSLNPEVRPTSLYIDFPIHSTSTTLPEGPRKLVKFSDVLIGPFDPLPDTY